MIEKMLKVLKITMCWLVKDGERLKHWVQKIYESLIW